MCKYKTNLNELERTILNNIDSEKIRKSLMSILSWVKKYGSLKMSYSVFLEKYNRSHAKLSLATLKRRIKTLVELKLVAVDTGTTSTIFSYCEPILNQKRTDSEVDEAIENTDVDEASQNTQMEMKSILDLDTISTSHEVVETNTFNFDSMIAKEKKAMCLSQLYITIKECFKDMRVKSEDIKEKVVEKIDRNIENITLRFAKGYILKTIEQVRNDYNIKRQAYRKTIFNNMYSKTSFCDFEQRSYNFAELESQLLGANEYDPKSLLNR